MRALAVALAENSAPACGVVADRETTGVAPLAPLAARQVEQSTRLVKDAGFEPVVVGALARARLFDVGTPVYTQLLTAKELRARLGM